MEVLYHFSGHVLGIPCTGLKNRNRPYMVGTSQFYRFLASMALNHANVQLGTLASQEKKGKHHANACILSDRASQS